LPRVQKQRYDGTVKQLLATGFAAIALAGTLCGQVKSGVASESASVSGRILDRMETGIPNSTVRLVVLGSSAVFAETKTDNRGRFRFAAVPPNKYGIQIAASGFRATRKTLEIEAGKDLEIGNIVLQEISQPEPLAEVTPDVAMSAVTGRVSDVAGGPIANGIVTLRNVSYPRQMVSVKTDGSGLFTLTGVPPGRYELSIDASGFPRKTVPVEASAEGGTVELGTSVLKIVTESPMEIISESPVVVTAPRTFRGRYVNEDYGFSVQIPKGMIGSNAPAPAPNHGFGIDLGKGSSVWVDASYEINPHQFGRMNARLGDLKAERKVFRQFHQSVVARGYDRGSPIIYTIRCNTTAEHQAEALRVFNQLVKSFRRVPIHP
jgi:hypothetical protein